MAAWKHSLPGLDSQAAQVAGHLPLLAATGRQSRCCCLRLPDGALCRGHASRPAPLCLTLGLQVASCMPGAEMIPEVKIF